MHARVYIWPLLTEPGRKSVEETLVECGYTRKKPTKIGKHIVYVCR